MMAETYDFKWLGDVILKRRANYANVVCIETVDPFRLSQTKAFLSHSKDYKNTQIYYIDRWNGLSKVDKQTGNLNPVKRGAGGGYDKGVSNQISEIRDALLYMDDILKKKKAVLILHDLDADREEEKDRDMISALRNWTYDSSITYSGSLIILICRDASMVLDPLTIDRIPIIRPPLATARERALMIRDQWGKLINQPQDESGINILVQTTTGLNIHQLKTVLCETYYRSRRFSVETIKRLKTEFIERTGLLEIEEPDPAGFNAVGGYEVVKEFVKDTIIKVLLETERAKRFILRIPRGIILFGPPGTGKTLFARALAREVNLPFINLRVENLLSPYLGVSGHRFREAIQLIEQMSPAIVFIDEIDRLGKRRGDVNDGASEETRRVFNQVLEWLGKKERKSIIIGTTNRPSDLDEAFRVGRIDYWIPILYPDRDARTAIIRVHLEGTPLSEDAIRRIADHTEGFTGAEIEELIQRARRIAFRGSGDVLTEEHVDTALRSFRIDKSQRERDQERFLKMAEKFTNDLELLSKLRGEHLSPAWCH